jgi:hypothetical protein
MQLFSLAKAVLLALLVCLGSALALAQSNDVEGEQRRGENGMHLFGAQHFQPCYFINGSVPCLLDGAQLVSNTLGSTIFKFALKSNTPGFYPFNNVAPYAWPVSFSTMTDVAKTAQVDLLLRNGLGTHFTTFVLWAYSVGTEDSYWCNGDGLTPAQEATETAQFEELTLHLLTTYRDLALDIFLEHWEGDWAARCGSYDPHTPPSSRVARNMVQWLAARQRGVDMARASQAVQGSNVRVFHGTEVNLVVDSIHNASFGNIIRSVVPFVRLDTVSYSSYEAQADPVMLAAALDFIFASMNRTAASPRQPVFITEWGSPQTEVTAAEALAVAQSVVNVTRAKSASYLRMALHWQVINNELAAGGLCQGTAVDNPALQRGFWEVMPSGELSVVGAYLQRVIAGQQ